MCLNDRFSLFNKVVLIVKTKILDKECGGVSCLKLFDAPNYDVVGDSVLFGPNVSVMKNNNENVRDIVFWGMDREQVVNSFDEEIIRSFLDIKHFKNDVDFTDFDGKKIPLHKGNLLINYSGDSNIKRISALVVWGGLLVFCCSFYVWAWGYC